MTDRIPARQRLAMADINNEWKRLVALLPNAGDTSEIEAKELVEEQWVRTREAYSGMGLVPSVGLGD